MRGKQNEIKRLLAAALDSDAEHAAELQRQDDHHVAEMQRHDDMHVAETERRDVLHLAELGRRDQLHVDEMALLATALDSRDTIGQAKGVLIVTFGCSPDEAFQLLRTQSQRENRKLVDVAAEIVDHAQRTRRAS